MTPDRIKITSKQTTKKLQSLLIHGRSTIIKEITTKSKKSEQIKKTGQAKRSSFETLLVGFEAMWRTKTTPTTTTTPVYNKNKEKNRSPGGKTTQLIRISISNH